MRGSGSSAYLPGLAALVLSAGGCGSSIPSDGAGGSWAGLYQVTRHTKNRQGCDLEGPPAGDAPYFRLNLTGDSYRFSPCDSPTADCGFGSVWFDKRTASGWTGVQAGSSSSGTLCTLFFKAWSLTRAADGTVRVEIREHSGLGMEGQPCSADEARRRGTSLDCRLFEVIEGRLPGAAGTGDAGQPVPDGPTPDGGSADAARGAPGSGVPCSMLPCGGNLIGRWQIRAVCHARGQPLANLTCPKISYDRSALVTTGEMSFTADRYEMKLIHRGTMTVSYSLACPQARSCADFERTLRPSDPAVPATVTCSESADICSCTIEARDLPDQESGPYRADNLLLATTPAGVTSEDSYQFCVEGAYMKIAGPITPGPNGEKVTAGIFTLSRMD